MSKNAKKTIDWLKLELVMEPASGGPIDSYAYVHRETGALLLEFGGEAIDQNGELVDTNDEVWEPLPTHDWRTSVDDLRRFARRQPGAPGRRLLETLDGGRGLFRRYRNALRELGLQDAFEEWVERRRASEIRDWLEARGLDFELVVPWNDEDDEDDEDDDD